jgi:predicted membrane channel-forming protein YqfA (hemolysin III family)
MLISGEDDCNLQVVILCWSTSDFQFLQCDTHWHCVSHHDNKTYKKKLNGIDVFVSYIWRWRKCPHS